MIETRPQEKTWDYQSPPDSHDHGTNVVEQQQDEEAILIVQATSIFVEPIGESVEALHHQISEINAAEAQVVTIDEPDEGTPLVMSTREVIQQQLSHDETSDELFPSIHKEHDTAPKFRDWPFGVVFWCHIALLLCVGLNYSSSGYQRIAQDFNLTLLEQQALAGSDDGGLTPEDLAKFERFVEDVYEYVQGYMPRIVLYIKVPACIVALILVDITLTCIRPCTKLFVQATLICCISSVIIFTLVVLIAAPSFFTLILACVVIGAVSFFACNVYPLVPFVAVNLKVALQGIGHNLGTYLWAIFFTYLCVVFVLFWFYTLFGLSFLLHIQCEDRKYPDETIHWEKDDDDDCQMGGGVFLLLVLSLYWTTNVIINYLRCTVAGVMATWLYAKDDARCCCSCAVWGSLMRGATYSFGSICLGSLFQGVVSCVRCVIASAKRNRDNMNNGHNTDCCGGLCFCIVDFVASISGKLLDYFSQWNYIYISLYGLSYIESGKAVMQLFEFKGWRLNAVGSQSIISERLTSFVLGNITFMVGLVTGGLVLLVERIVTMRHPGSEHESYVFGPLPNWRMIAFIIGFIIGIVVSSILMNVVKGAVNTVIVCWADNRERIAAEHPCLGQEMVEAWTKSFPHSVTVESRQQQGAIPTADAVTLSASTSL